MLDKWLVAVLTREGWRSNAAGAYQCLPRPEGIASVEGWETFELKNLTDCEFTLYLLLF